MFQSVRWKEEWTVPHRLLQKRSIASINNVDCKFEWLVKWCGLGYEHATWELENAHFLNSSKGRDLIRDYEDRHKRASGSSSLTSMEKVAIT